MRSHLAAFVLTASVICPAPVSAATIYTFSIDGTSDFDTDSIESYSFTPSAPGGTLQFTKAIDATSDDITAAVALGTTYSGATFIAYQDVVSPQTELFRYTLTDVLFTSSSLGSSTQQVSLQAGSALFVPAGGATVFTFSVGGTTDFDTDAIRWFAFVPSGSGGTLTFTKDLDATSDDILLATAMGTLFSSATFIGYDGVISPDAEVFRYVLSQIMFASVTLDGLTTLETVSVVAEGASRREGPASVPEPASGLLCVTAGVILLAGGRGRGLREKLRR